MTAAEERELEALRERVYGPNGGLADDQAISRLRQLEEARRPTVPRRVEVDVMERPSEPVTPHEPEPEPPPRWETAARWLLTQLERVPRLVIPIVLAVAALVTLIVVTVTLVDRLQSEPLVTAAEEVTRLTPDPTYELPQMFTIGSTGGTDVQAFESFYGLRSIVGVGGVMFGNGSAEVCLNVFSEADVEDPEADGFSGFILGGCAAPGFPASTQFVAQMDGLPLELRAEFPDSALQFVYDSETNEVIVYESPL